MNKKTGTTGEPAQEIDDATLDQISGGYVVTPGLQNIHPISESVKRSDTGGDKEGIVIIGDPNGVKR